MISSPINHRDSDSVAAVKRNRATHSKPPLHYRERDLDSAPRDTIEAAARPALLTAYPWLPLGAAGGTQRTRATCGGERGALGSQRLARVGGKALLRIHTH